MTADQPLLVTPPTDPDEEVAPLRVGQAAEMLGVTVETLRRWEADVGEVSVIGRSISPIAEHEGSAAEQPDLTSRGQVPVERSEDQRRAALHTDSFVAGRRSSRALA